MKLNDLISDFVRLHWNRILKHLVRWVRISRSAAAELLLIVI